MRRELNEYPPETVMLGRFMVWSVVVGIVLALFAVSAFATKTPSDAQDQEQVQNQNQAQAQGQIAAQDQTQGQIASGGNSQIGDIGTGDMIAGDTSLSSNPVLTSSPSYSNRETSVAIGNTAVIPAQVADCYRPKNKMGRAFRVFFGLWEMSATVELDPACIAAKDREAQNEIDRLATVTRQIEAQTALIEAETARELAIAERIRAVSEADASK